MEKKLFDFKKLAILIVGFFLVAFSFLVLAGKGVTSIKNLYNELKNEKQDAQVLKENIETLKKVDLTFTNKSDQIFMTLPDTSFAPLLISSVKTEAQDKILIDSIKSEDINLDGDIQGVSLTYEGKLDKLDNLLTFVEELQKYSPITAFERVELNEVEGKYNVNFKVATFWADLPTELPKVDVAVYTLTDEEMKLMDDISRYKRPSTLLLNPQKPAERQNPFI